jgi:two-component system, chemotaxis family, sensor kinase CheA
VSDFDTELAHIFHDEATHRLDEMDAALLEVESGRADPGVVDSLFRHAHTIKGSAGMLGLDDIAELAHAVEDVLAQVREAKAFPPDLALPLMHATEVLRARVNGSEDPVDRLVRDLASAGASMPGHGGAPPVPVRPPEPQAAQPRGPEAAPPLVPEPARSPEPEPARPPEPEQAHRPEPGPARPTAPESARSASNQHTLRVPAAKIDHLLDVAGEILHYRRRLTHSLGDAGLSPRIGEVLDVGQRMLDDLRDTAVSMRTLPLSVITSPLPRAVRDIAHAAGKRVDFVVTGADTEIDRVILESLTEPLTHLLRNAVGHGIEAPAERERAGKPPRGRVELRGVPRGSMVEVTVADDGRGVSPETLEAAHSEGSLTDLLTRPGYSTAGEVTELAGRGVGLDAVKAHVGSLGGSLEVRSEPGRGMEVTLLLPLALALSEMLLLERDGAAFGVPLAAVEEVVMVTRTLTLQGQASLEVRGRSLPVVDVAAAVGAAAPPLGDRCAGVIISAGSRRVVAGCDALIGKEEVVVKPLGLASVPGYLGASILGDGRIALLIEPAVLSREPSRAAEAGSVVRPASPLRPPKVLVVEDSFTVRELQRSILEAAGYPVATARDGRDALAVLSRDSQIALVITDLDMPELDGIGLTRAIRADARHSSLPVVIVTSRGTEDDRHQGIEAGADAYMAKHSFDQQTMLATVERLVGR